MQTHTISPFYHPNSSILILGSFPSVLSRQEGFYYAHPQNRFYAVLAKVFNDTLPQTLDEKMSFLNKHHIALFDVVQSCNIEGSSDSSITNITPNDLRPILASSRITRIYTNGKLASTLYQKHLYPQTHIQAINLPSTSPANAKFSLTKLAEAWQVLNPCLLP